MMRSVGACFVLTIAACTPLKDDQPGAGGDAAGGGNDRADAMMEPADAAGALARDAGVDRDSTDSAMADAPAEATGDAEFSPVDAMAGDVKDVAPLPCEPLSNFASDIYVDAAATSGGYGAPGCPLVTITEALAAAARSNAAVKTIHVAAGTYDKTHGEDFPLEVRDGVALVGAGPTTVIQGGGLIPAFSYWQEFYATVTIGDRVASSALRSLRLLPALNTGDTESEGVFCKQGNIAVSGVTPEHNTDLDSVEIGPGFVHDVKIVGTSFGCNMRIVGSTFHGGSPLDWGVGVFVAGAGCGGFLSDGNAYPVALDLGDGTPAGGNTFSQIHGNGGWAVRVQGCITSFNATNNVIQDSDLGLWLESLPSPTEPAATITIVGNTFERIPGESARFGADDIRAGAVFIEASRGNIMNFSGNTFSQNRALVGGAPIAALTIGALTPNASFPATFKAHGNQFIGNDIGLLVQTRGTNTLTSASQLDFGVAGKGNNDFRCNSRSAGTPGGDVVIDANTDGTASISLSGNGWDHASPPIVTSATGPDGTDISLMRSANPSVDVTAARLSTVLCPAGSTP